LLRFAPSPTKDLDISDLRIAILNHIFSKQNKQDLLIRIDNTEKEKNIENKDKEIIELLDLFNIDYSRVIVQSENIKYHTGMGMKLLLDKKAFNCFCSDEALQEDKKQAKKENKPYSYSGFCETISDETKFNCNAPFVVRLKQPSENIIFNDTFKGNLEFAPFEIDSLIILNHDKLPTYNFACGIDDILYDISTIIRSEDFLEDTPKQINVRKSLGYDKEIQYFHIPKIKNSVSVKSLIDEGYLPIAIANYLVTLGFNTPKDIFTIEEACEWFDINKLSQETISFDKELLNKINKKHLETIGDMRLSKIISYADEDIGKLAKLYLDECSTTKEIKAKIDMIFSSKDTLKGFEEEFKTINECLSNAPFMNNFEDLKKYITEKTGLKDESLLIPLGYILTGAKQTPKLEDIYPLIKNYIGEIVK